MKSQMTPVRRNSTRSMPVEGTPPWEISEGFYASALALAQVAFTSINREYPQQERQTNTKILHFHAEAHRMAKKYLTRYKTIVRDDVLPLVKIVKHTTPYDAGQDRPTTEFRAWLDNYLYWLYKNLHDYAPVMLPDDEAVDRFRKSLDSTFETERVKLAAYLGVYEVFPVLTEADLKDE